MTKWGEEVQKKMTIDDKTCKGGRWGVIMGLFIETENHTWKQYNVLRFPSRNAAEEKSDKYNFSRKKKQIFWQKKGGFEIQKFALYHYWIGDIARFNHFQEKSIFLFCP